MAELQGTEGVRKGESEEREEEAGRWGTGLATERPWSTAGARNGGIPVASGDKDRREVHGDELGIERRMGRAGLREGRHGWSDGEPGSGLR